MDKIDLLKGIGNPIKNASDVSVANPEILGGENVQIVLETLNTKINSVNNSIGVNVETLSNNVTAIREVL